MPKITYIEHDGTEHTAERGTCSHDDYIRLGTANDVGNEDDEQHGEPTKNERA
jgi:hypothetical protein